MAAKQELKFVVRRLARAPGFAVTCIALLAVGIAVTTSAFTVVNTAIKHPVPFSNAERLVLIRERNIEKGFRSLVSYPVFEAWRTRSRLFEEIGAAEPRGFNLSGGAEPESIPGALATAGFFRTLGWKTLVGRSFSQEEERPGATAVVLISRRCWERRFGSDPGVIGRELSLDGEHATVIGVLEPIIGRSYYAAYEVWAPLVGTAARMNREARTLDVVGLLKPGTASAQAGSELAAIVHATAERSRTTLGWGAIVVPMSQIMAHTVPMYVVLLAVVILLLVIVCANIAALQLARSAGRQPEVAIRIALGASRSAILTHLLAEPILLAAAGGLLGFLLTVAVRQVVVSSVPELAELRLDATVLGFTVLVSGAAGLLFGLSPAISASRTNAGAMLKSGGWTLQGGMRGCARSVLVVCEMAIAVTLLTGLGLLVRTFIALRHADVGFRTDNLLTVSVSLPKKYDSPQQAVAFFRLATERLSGGAGVDSVAAVSAMPLGAHAGAIDVECDGRASGETVQGQYVVVTPDYFRTMGIPLRKGRAFTSADSAATPGALIVNQRAADVLWPGRDPIGLRVRLNAGEWRSVVGIVRDARQDLLRPSAPEFFVPHAQDAVSSMWMVVRTRLDARQLIAGLRSELRALEPGLRISAPATMDDVISGYFPGAVAVGIGAFCVAALFCATLGLYGVVSYVVSQRTHEFGVRIALGAGPGELRRLVLGHGLKLASAGGVIGLAAGFGVSRFLASMIVGIEVSHPLVFVAVAGLLAAVEVMACYLPARRAVRVSPTEALRYQ